MVFFRPSNSETGDQHGGHTPTYTRLIPS